MKRIKEFIKQLSLTQQLVSVVLISLLIYFVVLFVYINGTIDSTIRERLVEVAIDSQSALVNDYLTNEDSNIIISNGEKIVSHALLIDDNKNLHIIKNKAFIDDDEVVDLIIESSKKQQSNTKNYLLKHNDTEYIFVVTKIKDNQTMISCISDTYKTEYINAFSDIVVKASIAGFAIILIAVTAWSLHLILTLNQVKNYAKRISKGEDAELVLDRKDEVGDLGDAIVLMNEELKKQQRVKEELIHNISHDLKTPIATIKSYAESIKDGIYPYDSLEKSVDVIIEHSQRLENKVQSLLVLNRMDYLISNEETGNCDLKEVIDKVVLSVKVIKPDVEIIKNTKSSIFYGEEEPWRIALENILDNALRYAKSKIVITLDDDSVSIENDGSFIDEERMKKLFFPYEKGNEGKFGLGLSIVKKVVETYNCEIRAINTHDGVMFKIVKKYNKKKKNR